MQKFVAKAEHRPPGIRALGPALHRPANMRSTGRPGSTPSVSPTNAELTGITPGF